MRKIFLVVFLTMFCATSMAQNSELFEKLSALKGVSDIEQLENKIFKEKYQVFVTQYLDPNNHDAGTFKQRVFVCFRGFDRPTVLITEGYSAEYGAYQYYSEEISTKLEANVLVCEYRYFNESTPENPNWDYMTVDNSLADLHNVREIFGQIFPKKWLSTGISKGGSTCTYYRAAYPNDVDASVAYVAPISRAQEDGRHEKFMNKKVSSKEDRQKIADIMLEFMSRKPRLVPMLDSVCKARNLKFFIPIEDLFDYEVLEYEFSFWQWGSQLSQAPLKINSDEKWLEYLVNEVSPSYFAYPSNHLPFYYQAIKEFGYYGYDIKKLGKNASISSTKGYLKRIMAPAEWRDIKFDPTLYKRTCKYLKKNDPTHIFIYGEYDPWTASGVAPWLNCKKKQNMKIYVKSGGNHSSRINNMPDKEKTEIYNLIEKWMR